MRVTTVDVLRACAVRLQPVDDFGVSAFGWSYRGTVTTAMGFPWKALKSEMKLRIVLWFAHKPRVTDAKEGAVICVIVLGGNR